MMGIQMSYKYIPFIGTGVFVLVIALLLIYLLRVKLKEKREEENFERQLNYAIDPNEEEEEKVSYIREKLRVLPKMLISANLVKDETTVEDIQKRMLLIGAILFTIATILTMNPLGGFLPLIFIYLGVRVFATFRINKYRSLMDEQIPAFVSTFKANIQANQHAQNAMISAINNTASPLYDELVRPKSIMEAGDFRPGIISLRMNTKNETLRQMAACIELASTSGSNIEEQIETIEDIIEDKQVIEREKRLGVNENKPLFYIAALMVPVAFVGSYFMSDMHKEYWFSTTTSYLIIIGVIVAMAISSWATMKVIQKVDIG